MNFLTIHRRADEKKREKGSRMVKTLCGRLVRPEEAPTRGSVDCKACQKSLNKKVLKLYDDAIRKNKMEKKATRMDIKSRTVSQAKLTSECWSVQFWGLPYCKQCEFRDKPDCGGKKIRKTGKNSKGYKVPISDK